MLDSDSTLGSVEASVKQRKALALSSLEFNCKDKTFRSLFPHHVATYEASRQRVDGTSPPGLTPEDSVMTASHEPSSTLLVVSVVVSIVVLFVFVKMCS